MNFKPFFKSSQREFKPISNYSVICLDYPNNLSTAQSIVKLPNLKDAETVSLQAGVYCRGITMYLYVTENLAYRPLALELLADKDSVSLLLPFSDRLYLCSTSDFDDKTEVVHLPPTSQSNTTFSSPPVTEGSVTTDFFATAAKLITTKSVTDGQDDRL